MSKNQAKFIFLSLVLLFPVSLSASHEMAVEMVYECMGSCTTRVHMRAYRDCTGITSIPQTFVIASIPGGCTPPTEIAPPSPQLITEATPVCPGTPTGCSVVGAPIVGLQEYYWYQDFDFCSAGPCDFTFTWTDCCRNPVITSMSNPGSVGIYLISHYSPPSVTGTCNNSPVFTKDPFFYACAGQPLTVNQGAYDPDGDILIYSLISCRDETGNPVTYMPAFSPIEPLGSSWNVTLDPTNGNVHLAPVPGNIEVGVICYQVEEYRSGVLIGTYTRDMQVQITSCTPNNPPVIGPITNNSTNTAVTGSTVTTISGSGSICFDLSATDADTGQIISLFWDENIPGATFTDTTGLVTDTISATVPVARFCFNPPGPGTYQFLVTAKDNNCPFPGYEDNFINLIVLTPSDTLVGDLSSSTDCLTASFTATASGGAGVYDYIWDINGIPYSGAMVSHTFSSPGAYPYTLIVSDGISDPDTLIGTISVEFDLSGIVTTHLGAPLIGQTIYLIRYEAIGGGMLTAIDSTITDTTGFYSFCLGSETLLYVKAIPSLPDYPNDIPTYYLASATFAGASNAIAGGIPAIADFSTLAGINFGGPGFIGGFVAQGAGKTYGPGDPVPGLPIFLFSLDALEYRGHTITDAQGYFSFPDIPLGNYALIPDWPLVAVTMDSVPTLMLLAETSMIQDSLLLSLEPHQLVWQTMSSIPKPVEKDDFSLEIHPNLIKDQMNLEFHIPKEEKVEIDLLDLKGSKIQIMGESVFSSGSHRYSVNLTDMKIQPGIYFVKIQAKGQVRVKKIVVL